MKISAMRDLIAAMWERFGDEVPAIGDLANGHCRSYLDRFLIRPDHFNSTSTEDCLFLYLLIRHFGGRSVFEVGTYIGTTAVCMNEAARRNGGVLTTTDPIDYAGVPPWSGIRFIRGPALLGLQVLKAEGHQIDFCFFDCVPDAPTLEVLGSMLAHDAILATHDYGNNPKGEETVRLLNNSGLGDGRAWLLPDSDGPVLIDGLRINQCTAVCIPKQLIESAQAPKPRDPAAYP